MTNMTPIYQDLVRSLGGQVATAKALGVSQSTVSGYINGRWNMSDSVALNAEKVTNGKFKAIQLSPSLKDILKQLTA